MNSGSRFALPRWGRALALVACFGSLLGCGGSGLPVIFSLFEGDWAGDWVSGSADGTADISINENGNISGTMHSDTTGEDATVVGSIQNDGDVSMTVTFTGEAPEGGSGNLSFVSGDTIAGTVTFGAGDVDFSLDRQ